MSRSPLWSSGYLRKLLAALFLSSIPTVVRFDFI